MNCTKCKQKKEEKEFVKEIRRKDYSTKSDENGYTKYIRKQNNVYLVGKELKTIVRNIIK